MYGGSGFVGTRVLRTALASGMRVASVSRNGPPAALDSSLSEVEWIRADVEDPPALARSLEGADAVVSCIGAFGSNDFMRRINGDANASIVEAAAAAGVGRLAYISAATFRPVELVIPGYFEGKRIAEEAVTRHYGPAGAVLRPPAVYGTRDVGKYVKIPLGLIGVPLGSLFASAPMRSLANALGPLGDLMMPWVSVDDVAAAAVAHVLQSDDSGNGGGGSGRGGEATTDGSAGAAVVLDWKAIVGASSSLFSGLPPQATLFWDGGCPLCKTEIAYYKRIDVAQRVEWVDIYSHPER